VDLSGQSPGATASRRQWDRLCRRRRSSVVRSFDRSIVRSFDSAVVYALNADDGSQRWQVALASSSSANPSSSTLANGLLFLGAGMRPDGALGSATQVKYCMCLYALRVSDGAVIWTHSTGDQVFDAPTVVDGVVYASEFTDGLMALRASDGKLLWSQKGLHGSGAPTVANGVIYVAAFDQRIYAVSTTDGSQLWQTREGEVGPSDGGLAVGDGVVYVVDTGVVALRASDGTRLWRRGGDGDRLIFSHPLVVEGVVFGTASCRYGVQFVGYCQDQLVALRGGDGALFWSKAVTTPALRCWTRSRRRLLDVILRQRT
jgi:outer membrane protein assembly factor BamB